MIDAYSVHKDLEVTVTSALDTKGVITMLNISF